MEGTSKSVNDRFEKELAIFSEARQLPPERRAAYLDSACAGDLDLRRRIEELLLAAGQPLLSAAQDAHQIDGDLDLDQILDLVVAVAKIPGTREYRQPILDAALAGLQWQAGGV